MFYFEVHHTIRGRCYETIESREYERDEKYYLGFLRREVSVRSATADVNTTEVVPQYYARCRSMLLRVPAPATAPFAFSFLSSVSLSSVRVCRSRSSLVAFSDLWTCCVRFHVNNLLRSSSLVRRRPFESL